MLNFECLDETSDGKVELCFTDTNGDESVKIIVSEKTIYEIKQEINRKFSYAKRKNKLKF
jgi:hypothetical protein